MRKRKYTAAGLRRAVERYFRSISRTRPVTEKVASGETDSCGHPVYVTEQVWDDDGRPIMERQWVRPPTAGGLCAALGVHRSTWARWCDPREFPEFQEVTEWARDVLQGYLEDELLTREGKNIRGVEFTLSARYGWNEGQRVEVSGPGAEELLAKLAEQGGEAGV